MDIRSILAPNPGPFTLDGTRSWLLGDSVVVDPGPDIESHVLAIAEAMPALALILITHRHADHAPAALPLRRRTGAAIVAPAGVLEDEAIARRIAGGEILKTPAGEIEVIATPGHTREHVCFLTADGDLLTGDTVLGTGTTAIFPPDGHMGDYLRSLEILRSRRPKRIFPAHGPVRDDAVALLDEYIAHRLERERQILEAIAGGATTVTAIRHRVYPDLDRRLDSAAEIQITAHLIKLVEEQRADPSLLG